MTKLTINSMKQSIIIILVVLSGNLFAQSGDVAFADKKVEAAYVNYLQLKDALVASNADAAREAAGKLNASLAGVHHGKSASTEASKLSKQTSLEDIRKTFAALSTAMTSVVKSAKVSKGILYVEYCPMANKNTGAFWLSNDKEI